jgi:hypothetical protein
VLRNLSPDAKILTEEPFAPVMPVLDFSKLDDVIAAANNTKYGLAAYVFTNDLTVAWRMAEGLEAGIIGVNDPVPATPQCPFGGMKESGMGRELAHEGLEAYLETKYVSMLPGQDSNLDKESQNLLCYRYTTGYGWVRELSPWPARPIIRGQAVPVTTHHPACGRPENRGPAKRPCSRLQERP